jgi:hemerythrin
MEAFRWDQCFVTGLGTVDDQHHYLVNVVNQFGELLMRAEGATADEIEQLVGELKNYTIYHFSEEESLMQQAHFEPRYFDPHQKEHAQFLQDVTHMYAGMSGDNREAATALLNFLSNWLAYHILGSDQLMAMLMRAKAAGVSADEAYTAFQKSKDPATATLLQAMSRLVSQVSERSRALFELNQTLEARVAERTQELLLTNQRLESMAMTDVLTSLPNRRHALLVLEREWKSANTQGVALACMMIDADGFKKINDSCGHDAGDEVLRQLARCLKQAVRNDDIVCRLGGDEFLIICVGTPLDGALHIAEKVRQEVAALRVPVGGGGYWMGSVSIGVAARHASHNGAENLLKAADEGVYLAKANGRNCVASVQTNLIAIN